MDLATLCAGLQVSESLTRTASGGDGLTAIRIADPGMEVFYGANGSSLNKDRHDATFSGSPIDNPSDNLGTSPHEQRIQPISLFGSAAAPPLRPQPHSCPQAWSRASKTSTSKSSFAATATSRERPRSWPIPFDPADGFTHQRDAWRRRQSPSEGRSRCGMRSRNDSQALGRSSPRLSQWSRDGHGRPDTLFQSLYFSGV